MADQTENTLSRRAQIEALARQNADVHAFMQMHRYHGGNWVDTLEAMVLHLATALDESRSAHLRALQYQTRPTNHG